MQAINGTNQEAEEYYPFLQTSCKTEGLCRQRTIKKKAGIVFLSIRKIKSMALLIDGEAYFKINLTLRDNSDSTEPSFPYI